MDKPKQCRLCGAQADDPYKQHGRRSAWTIACLPCRIYVFDTSKRRAIAKWNTLWSGPPRIRNPRTSPRPRRGFIKS